MRSERKSRTNLTISGALSVVSLWKPRLIAGLDPLPIEFVQLVPPLGVGPTARVVLKGTVTVAGGRDLGRGCRRRTSYVNRTASGGRKFALIAGVLTIKKQT